MIKDRVCVEKSLGKKFFFFRYLDVREGVCLEKKICKFKRADGNPIILPAKNHAWESYATFNPAAIYLGGKVHILYRAMSDDKTSVLGYASSSNGVNISCRLSEPVYRPREDFEKKLKAGENSGCEDPRITEIGDRIYMCYTAFNGIGPARVALTWIKREDFLNKKWKWSKPVLISNPNVDDKNACVFPEPVEFNGDKKFIIFHRLGSSINYSLLPNLDFENGWQLEGKALVFPRENSWDSKKVGIGPPPIKTNRGWILIYHGVSDDFTYRVGAVLLDLRNPLKVVARTDFPIFEPETEYEKVGQVNNVVFPCGAVLIGKKIFMYYGGADRAVGVAIVNVEELLDFLDLFRVKD